MPQTRKPAVAGYFYEAHRDKLIEQIEWSIRHPLGPGQLIKQPREGFRSVPIVIVPHAGYIYSGPIAAMSFAEIYRFHNPRTFIIVGPNHYGVGSPVAIYPDGVWETPLGSLEVDSEVAKELMNKVKYLEPDVYAFSQEHSLEVQLPFIQYIFGNKNPNLNHYIETDLLISTDPKADAQAIEEAARMGIPVIAFVDTDTPISYVDLIIPCNNKGRRSLALMYWLLARQVLRVRGELKENEDLPVSPEEFEVKVTVEGIS